MYDPGYACLLLVAMSQNNRLSECNVKLTIETQQNAAPSHWDIFKSEIPDHLAYHDFDPISVKKVQLPSPTRLNKKVLVASPTSLKKVPVA